MIKRRAILTFGVVALFLMAAPVMAAPYELTFNINSPQMTYSSGTFLFSAMPRTNGPTAGSLINGTNWAYTYWPTPGDAAFTLTMTLGSITATTASATGSFLYTDIEGDTVGGDLAGTWDYYSGGHQFNGSLSNVAFTANVDQNFQGDYGTLPIPDVFPEVGAIQVQLPVGTPWFTTGSFNVSGGSIQGVIAAPVPIPGAVLLGFLGLTAGGLGLRRLS